MVVGEISQQRNLVIIGGGPGGYTAAIRGAQLGLSVTLIEQGNMGGVCLNEGCIPSKVFTHAAGKRSETVHLREMGIGEGDDIFNLLKLQSYKTKVMDGLRAGVERLCQENRIEIIRGKATFISLDRIGVENGHQFDIFEFKHAIIAAGSHFKCDGVVSYYDEMIRYFFKLEYIIGQQNPSSSFRRDGRQDL